MNYGNHFTSRAIKAIEFAQYAARELEQDYIGTEHILLGLLHEEGSVAFAALQAAGVARERLVLDPGFGFGKRTVHNFTLLDRKSVV